MTPLSWLKEKKIYYLHYTAADTWMTAESRKSLMKNLTVNTLIHAPLPFLPHYFWKCESPWIEWSKIWSEVSKWVKNLWKSSIEKGDVSYVSVAS